jgi:hypothetical protein
LTRITHSPLRRESFPNQIRTPDEYTGLQKVYHVLFTSFKEFVKEETDTSIVTQLEMGALTKGKGAYVFDM